MPWNMHITIAVTVYRSCIPKKSATHKVYSKDHKTVADEFNELFAGIGQNTVNLKS
jgi:hypothetical protein